MIFIPQERVQLIIELFLQVGYRSPSMLDIAKHIGVSTKTLYQYVKNKQELILICLEVQGIELQTNLEIIKKNESSQTLFIVLEQLLNFHQRYNQRSLIELKRYYPDAFVMYEQLFDKIMQVFSEHISTGIKAGLYDGSIQTKEYLYLIDLLIRDIAHNQIRNIEISNVALQNIVFAAVEKLLKAE